MKTLRLFFFLLLTTLSLAQEGSPEYNRWLYAFTDGIELIEKGEYKDAKTYLEEAYVIAKDIFENDSENILLTIEELSNAYLSLKQIDKAMPLIKKEFELSLRLYGKDSQGYSTALLKYLKVLNNLKLYDQSLPLLQMGFDTGIQNKILDETFGYCFSSLIGIQIELGKNEEALEIFRKGENALQDLGLDLSDAPASYLSLKGEVLLANDYYNEANALLALAIKKFAYTQSLSKEERLLQVKALLLYGQSFYRLGDNQNAIKIYNEALPLCENQPEVSYLEYKVRILNNLSLAFERVGLYDKAIFHLKRTEDLIKTLYTEASNEYSLYLNNLGVLYMSKLDFKEAEIRFKNALKSTNDSINLNYNLAILNAQTGNTKKAIEYLEKLKDDPSLRDHEKITIYTSLGTLFSESKDYKRGNYFFSKGLEMIKEVDSENTDTYANLLFDSGTNYQMLEQHRKAIKQFKASYKLQEIKINKFLQFGDDYERWRYVMSNTFVFDYLKTLEFFDKKYSDLVDLNLNNTLWLKVLLLDYNTNMFSELKALKDPTIGPKINDYKTLKNKIAFEYSKPVFKQNRQHISKLEEKKSKIELEFQEKLNTKSILKKNKNWTSIRDVLKEDEIAIEFSRFQNINNETRKRTDSILYVAYVIKKEWKLPKMLTLFEEKQLMKLLEDNDNPNKIYQTRGGQLQDAKTQNTTKIYDLVWKPLEEYTQNSKTVYYSPDGILHKVAFSALGKKNQKRLCETYNLVRLSSTSNITDIKDISEFSSAFVMGDINFNYKEKSNPSLTKLQNRSYTPKTFSHVINSLNYSPWKNLSGAKEEIHNLQNLFNTPSIDVQFVQGNAATEEVFKGLSGKSPKVIHIATHGFFFKNQYSTQTKEEVSNSPKKVNPFFRDMYLNQYEIALNPLLRSGLILAGGNYAWQYGDNPYEAEDGILTALEISNLDLSNTDLVVLSACETGLGDVESSEGIYGLQRAFKMAGVNSIIMSLWQVPDKETAEFMTNFYENWLSNQSARQAFKTTQLQMAKKYRTEPEKWAGFVYFE